MSILDGTSPTGAFSFSRKLLSAYTGPFYTDTGGAITAVHDQTGLIDLTDNSVSSQRPTLSTGGPRSRACADFNGTTNYLRSTTGTRFGLSSKYMIVSFIPDVIDATRIAATSWLNPSFCIGVTSGPKLFGQAFDGVHDQIANPTAVPGTFYVVSLRHDGTTLFLRPNNGTEEITLSGASTANGTLGMGNFDEFFGLFFDGKIFELATWDVVPDLATRNVIEPDFKDWVEKIQETTQFIGVSSADSAATLIPPVIPVILEGTTAFNATSVVASTATKTSLVRRHTRSQIMLEGVLRPTSNLATWTERLELYDSETGQPIDLVEQVERVTISLRDIYTGTVVLTGDMDSGAIVVVNPGIVEWSFPPEVMYGLDPKSYDVGCLVEMAGETIQVLLGHISVKRGL